MGLSSLVDAAKLDCWIMERSSGCGMLIFWVESTTGRSGNSSALIAVMRQVVSLLESLALMSSLISNVIVSPVILRAISPNRRAFTTNEKLSWHSA